MGANDLLDLADDSNFIPGIYNYCDRWCGRCAYSARCFLYSSEKADPDLDDPELRDLNNARFWQKLALIFKDTHDLIKQCAEEAGVDLDSIEAQAALQANERKRETARKHELSVLARDYAKLVEEWFPDQLADERKIFADGARADAGEGQVDIAAALEIIRWYQFFIAAKTFRALLRDDEEPDEESSDDDDVLRDAAQNDSNGSAKVALIAIDRSMSAWRVVETTFPGKAASIAPMSATLEELRDGIEAVLPGARDFVRPGFDEVELEFVC